MRTQVFFLITVHARNLSPLLNKKGESLSGLCSAVLLFMHLSVQEGSKEVTVVFSYRRFPTFCHIRCLNDILKLDIEHIRPTRIARGHKMQWR